MKRLIVLTIAVLFLFTTLSIGMSAATAPADNTKKVTKSKKSKKKSEPTVYVKEKGKKYHKKNCKLVKGKKGIPLSEAIKKGYTPCAVCKPPTLKKTAPIGKSKKKKK